MAEEEKILNEEEVKEETVETAEEAAETEEEAVEGTVEDAPEEQAEDSAEETENADNAAKEDKKSFFKKKDKKTDELNEKLGQITDQYQRLMAEFDNYRKRTEKEKNTRYDMGISSAVEKILPVLDNFERGLTAVPEADRSGAAYTGMDMIYKQLVKVLTDMGVEEIEAEGKEFDPNLHNAVMQAESDELPENTVAQVFMKGYTYKGSVIRFAAVSVVK